MASMLNSSLQAVWFKRLEVLDRATSGQSGLQCATRCTARCCPHAAMGTREPTYTVSGVAIMLPFELEYIAERTGMNLACFRRIPVAVAPGGVVEIGAMDIEMLCPFLTDDFRCSGYAFRPMDCRSFPMTPVFGTGGELTFRLASECPSLDTFSPDYQTRLKAVWREILPHLSADYRTFYNEL